MSEKRRDNKNRILHDGESQLSDGRYRFRYTDSFGKKQDVYSWRLDKNDPIPIGKKSDISLREYEKRIQADLFDKIATNGGNYSVIELVEKYVSTKVGVRQSTRTGYETVIRFLKTSEFGKRRIDKIHISDAKLWLIKLQKEYHKSYSQIHTIRGVLRPAFRMAVDDDLIRKNPFDFELVSVIINDSVTRQALTREQERNFLKFIKDDKHFSKYYEAVYILFNTGMRISEFTGLTITDIDFKEHKIKISKQLVRNTKMEYLIEPPKTEAGNREIPMTDTVEQCFRNILSRRINVSKEPMIDGHVGFLFLDKNGMPMVAMHWEKYFNHIVEKYNSVYKKEMPNVTPHICRHTFCTNMAKAGMNPKTLQYIMGHSDISVTLNTYTHFNFEDAKQELTRMAVS